MRAARPALVSVAALTLALSACSGGGEPASTSPSSTAGSSSTSPTPPPSSPAPVVVTGGDAALTKAVAGVYAGRTGIRARATTGSWMGTPVAVVESGQDVTLLVRERGAAWSVVGGWWPTLGKPAPQLGDGPVFVLALGSDARKGQPIRGSRTDTIQIIGMDLKGGGGIVGIARDVWAPLPRGGKGKINAAFSQAGGPGMKKTVQAISGLPISSFGVTTFEGFIRLVHAYGGIPMNVTTPIHSAALGVTIPAGIRNLTGLEALVYARERKSLPDGDFGRSRHQGELIAAAGIKARLRGIGAVPGELTVVSKFIETDLSATQALRLSAAFFRLEPSKVGRAVIKGSISTSSDGQSIVRLGADSRAIFDRFRDGRL